MNENPPQPSFTKGESEEFLSVSKVESVKSPPLQRGEASEARGGIFRRGPWENLATLVIATGIIMLMQPYSIWLYGHSFKVILIGTVAFLIVSHFPEQ